MCEHVKQGHCKQVLTVRLKRILSPLLKSNDILLSLYQISGDKATLKVVKHTYKQQKLQGYKK